MNVVVFKKYSDVLVTIQSSTIPSVGNVRGDSSLDVIKANWSPQSASYKLYIQPFLSGGQLRGAVLCSVGLPRLSLSWTGKTANKVGRYTKPIEKFFGRRGSSSAVEDPSFGLTERFMGEVGEFLISQLQLVAEMCLGRNYPVMREMEMLYPYEVLMTILNYVRSDRLKAAAANLTLTLYIDRDPQASIQLPRFTRTVSESKRQSSNLFVSVESKRFGEFGILQSILSTHFRKIQGKPFCSHTYSYICIVYKLMMFHFYGDNDRMLEIIDLLVSLLKRDAYDMIPGADGTDSLSVEMLNHQATSRNKLSRRQGTKASNLLMSRGKSKHSLHGEEDSEEDDKSRENNTMEGVLERMDSQSLPPNIWQRTLDLFESIPMNILMIIVACAATAKTVYDYVEGVPSNVWIFYAVFAFFGVEFCLHLFFHLMAGKSLSSFVLNMYNVFDFIVLMIFLLELFQIIHFFLFAAISRALRFLIIVGLMCGNLLRGHFIAKKVSENEEFTPWNLAERYAKTSESTLKTMVKIGQTLCRVQENIADLHLSMLLKAYYKTVDSSDEAEVKRDFAEIFRNAENLSVSHSKNDLVFLDMIMYDHPPLVQVALQLLMNHHSTRRNLIANTAKLQLITSQEGENEYQRMESIISKLRTDADKHEIWGKLVLAEHLEISECMHKYLVEITNYCKKRRAVLEFDCVYEPVKASQNILRNLGCFELCIKILHLMKSIDSGDKAKECHANTRKIVLLANRMMYWFILENPSNQALAFGELAFFIKTIDEGIESHLSIIAIFRDNLKLMELVPKKHIADFVTMICNNTDGRRPEYLSLMSSIINVGEKNVIANQYEVIKLMSAPDNLKRVVKYFCPVNSAEYAKKISAMAPYLAKKDVEIAELPNELAYHLELMSLLSRCTIGISGMTTIEAKVQSMYFFVDIVQAMLDPQCMLLGKIRLGLFLFNAVVDVETLLPAMKDANCFWLFMFSTEEVFAFAKDELRQIEKNGWEAPTSNRQKIEYMIVCAMLVNGYFSHYYDPIIFRPDMGQTLFGVERVQIKELQANELIKSLYSKVMLIYETVSPLLSVTHHLLLYNTLVSLNNAASVKLVATVPNLHERFLKSEEEYAKEADSTDADATFGRFVSTLTRSKEIEQYASDQLTDFVATLESLPWKDSPTQSDIRFEPIFEKIISHIRATVQISTQGDEIVKYISPEATATAMWALEIFRTMIEKRWGMTIFERDENGGEEQDAAIADILGVYHSCGIAEMCLDLISKGINEPLQVCIAFRSVVLLGN